MTITVDSAGNNCIVVIPGANYHFLPEQLQSRKAVLDDASIIVIVTQLEILLETIKYALRTAKGLGNTTILNPAPDLGANDVFLSCVGYSDPERNGT